MDPDPYRTIATDYRRILPVHRKALEEHLGQDLDRCVEAIRDDRPNPAASDALVRAALASPRQQRSARLMVLHALAPKLRRRIATLASPEYHADAMGNLALVLLDSDLSGTGMAHRIVNRAHNRTWRAARRVLTSGGRQPITTRPYDPDRLVHLRQGTDLGTDDIAERVADRVDLARFAAAIEGAVDAGDIPAASWAVYRDHRLRGALLTPAAPSNGARRIAAHRAAHRLAPYIDSLLDGHAA